MSTSLLLARMILSSSASSSCVGYATCPCERLFKCMFDVCNVDALSEHGFETVDDDTLVVNPSPRIVCKTIEKNQARPYQLHAVTEAIAFRMGEACQRPFRSHVAG